MKTHAIKTNTFPNRETTNPAALADGVNHGMRLAAKAFLAAVPALAIVVLATWLVTVPELVVYLQATLWASGFVFLGLAIESESPDNGLSLLTGIALPVLAVMSSRVAVEIAVIDSVIIAIWLAVAIWRR
jgi:hypothetical protein